MSHDAVYLVKKTHEKQLLSRRNVVSVGIGYKITGGHTTDEVCVVVGVTQKLPEIQLKKKEIVPKTVGSCKTDVVEVGQLRALEHATGRFRPAPGGVSIGHKDITAGTLGCLVTKNNETFILSNNHVLANSNMGLIGDPILQPGPHDGGNLEEDQIGTLSEFVEINFGGTGNIFLDLILRFLCLFFGMFCQEELTNRVDAALAKPDSPNLVKTEILNIGSPTGWSPVNLNESIKKSGRTTDLTQGSVLQVGATVQVQYGAGRMATFEDQIMAGPISDGGDSGSAVLNENNRVVGLLFAGSAQVTIINPIEYVLEELGVEILV